MDPKPSSLVEKRKLTLEEMQIAQSIEDFPYLEMREKIFILLIWRGLKKASPVSIPDSAPAGTIDNLQTCLSRAGLFSEIGPFIKENIKDLRPGRIVYVADSLENLNLISKLWFGDHDKDEEVYNQIGELSGFPESAVDLYGEFSKLPEPRRNDRKNKLVLSVEEKKVRRLVSLRFIFLYVKKQLWK